jgi:hypothetical protein
MVFDLFDEKTGVKVGGKSAFQKLCDELNKLGKSKEREVVSGDSAAPSGLE